MKQSVDLKYRPKTFEEVEGNDAVIESLMAWIDNPNRKRVLLFSGPPGCGKTTLAKLVANKLGCTELNFRNLNISNTGGVDDARALIDDMRYSPKGGGVKVYLLDECQEASIKFQQALLTPLEDKLPAYAYVMFCTTDPHKLKPALKSRCIRFDVKPLTASQLRKLLRKILQSENIAGFPDKAIDHISQVSESPREALVLLDKVLDVSDEHLAEAIEKAKEEESTVGELCRALLDKRRWPDVAAILRGLQKEKPESIRRGVLNYCNTLLISGKISPQAGYIIQCFASPFYDSDRAGLTLACLLAVTD